MPYIALGTAVVGAVGSASKSGPMAPTRNEQQASVNLGFDSSGFSVATGQGRTKGASYGGNIPWIWIIGGGAALLLLVVFTRK